ncbi:bifunctional acetate--CoA ligase family protein/GNAT family N-acetyltransferase [Aurantimonas sp. VKM B-3413]|uniref:bifunctional acetate--CoA ligase family protein/GNAT family N-acetyltransferase n=1 Tax=Aurantimonas sp. VKM B-3413 TaxID=2779401 RepID=UPI001E468A52|nr:bifunctional acetate--CoA ligase family protein/GNAT family N-acetyltransferase [Aurantimonas sp. VKM B-3413]MCB8836562.1 bifunctional acetate--CoA ligase family protein/GNAT family N-acetyltransferase [Aurantimonas sp. VKM B-3413]
MSTRNFDALFSPRSIALIGASNEPHSVGNVIARNLFEGGFSGPIMPVNPHEAAIAGRKSFTSVSALPLVPDLAIVATPAPTVPGIVGELAARGCRAAVVISAGLGETRDGATLRQAMLDAARPHLMRIVGPNCLGILSQPLGINGSFSHLSPKAGDIALVSQSGAIVTAILDWADERGIGFSHVVSLGDMCDVDFGDMLDFLSTDRATRSILLYVENITFAKKFMSAARIAARSKPVVVIKAGRSAEGAKAALSHTGALAGSDKVYDGAFRRAGVLRVGELEELFEAASTLSTGIRITGDRLTILTNGGGAGVLAVDALKARGGTLATISEATLKELDAVLPPTWSHGNPVDIIGDATGARYGAALEALLKDRESDAILVINCPTAVADVMEAGKAVIAAKAKRPRFPVLTNWLGGTAAAPVRQFFASERIPTFESPDKAVRAFTHLVRYRRNQELLMETPTAGVAIAPEAVERARKVIEAAKAAGHRTLSEWEAKAVLKLFGIPAVETFLVTTDEEAEARFREIGAPAALKIVSPDITHKSDVGGVRLDIASAAAMRTAVAEMRDAVQAAAPEARITGFTVQRMVSRPDAYELIAGLATDATFGPVVLFGRGGKATEVIGDRAIGLPPLNSVLAREMIRETEIAKLLAGYRDVPAVPLDPIADVLIRLAELAVLLPEVAELDINPLLADAEGVVALDARVTLRADGTRVVGPAIRPYPRELEREITIRDAERFLLRPIRPEDELALADMVAHCTDHDLRLRFMGPIKVFPHQTAARFSQIDYDREMAFVAVAPGSSYGEGPISGVVRLVADPENEAAEFAVLVRSDMKGHGLGYALMNEILAYGRNRGLARIYGEVLRENATMLRMARELGFHLDGAEAGADTARVTVEFGGGQNEAVVP